MSSSGRPKKQPAELRSARLPRIRLTDAERADLEAKAALEGMSLSEWVRKELTNSKARRAPAATDKALLTELNRIGNNLNQIARALNRGRPAPDYFDQVLHQLYSTLENMARRYGA
jgi:hypothetical protein